jgi:endonuclease YncB( thermonuclease family)
MRAWDHQTTRQTTRKSVNMSKVTPERRYIRCVACCSVQAVLVATGSHQIALWHLQRPTVVFKLQPYCMYDVGFICELL